MSEILTAIDVGTTKICTFIADHDPDGRLRLLGAGCARSQGLRRGVVVNIAAATQAISESIEIAEHESGVPVRSAYVGIVGGHIQSLNGSGAVAIARGRSITRQDIDRALDAARAIPVESDREIIHTIARNFTIDQLDSVPEPLGMHGYRLEVNAHIITGATTAINNLVKCIQANGLEIDELVLEPLASGEAVLTKEEKEMGVAIADIGGGTTDIAIFLDDAVWHTMVINLGGYNLTKDLATGLRTTFDTAEQLKLRYGHALPEWVAEDEFVNAPAFGDSQTQAFSRRFIAEILEARSEEMLHLIMREIRRSGYDGLLPAGIVLTGGSAKLLGLKEMGQHILKLPVRLGVPQNIGNVQRKWLTPSNACGFGLLLWAQRSDPYESTRQSSPMGSKISNWLKNLLPH